MRYPTTATSRGTYATLAVAALATTALLTATTAAAQDTTVMIRRSADGAGKVAAENLRVTVESKVTRGAPYSADAVTESVQQLADGNRIVTRTTTRIYRDGEGRVRREQLGSGGTDPVAINITDSVAGTTFTLDPASHTAFRNVMFFAGGPIDAAGPPPAGVATATILARRTPDGAVTTVVSGDPKATAEAEAGLKTMDETKMRVAIAGAGAGEPAHVVQDMMFTRVGPSEGKTTKEDLGEQTIEGIRAVGTRMTTEIAAGAIGNEQPITIVSEQWFSPDLQVLVMTRHTDPRAGETTYRLANVVRAEPPHNLFEMPSDYALRESVIRRDRQD